MVSVHDALTINIGDQMEVMTNGIFKSPVHRVTVNSRVTLAMFCLPQTEKDVGPVEDLITDETPRLYKNLTFTIDFFFKNYQRGRRPIDDLTSPIMFPFLVYMCHHHKIKNHLLYGVC